MERKYFTLFKSTFMLSAFTFGGGFVIIPLMKQKFVDELGWLEEEEMLNLTAIAQSCPGAVAVNAAILLGYKIAGYRGVLISILGTVLPPFFIITTISYFYEAFKSNEIIANALIGMQSGVAAVIFSVVFNMSHSIFKGKDFISIAVLCIAFIATFFLNINVVLIILATGIFGLVQTLRIEKAGKII
ncbi:MAG: chromate transporter [Erysipelotrichaceae bacterium]